MIAADKNPALVAMWTEAVKGWSPPEMISKPEYEKMRTAWRSKDFSEYPLHLLGFAGYGASYRGSWMASYEGGLCIGSTSRAVTKESKLVSKVEFICSDYTGLEIPPDSVIYCDPPYVESLGHHAFGFYTEE